MSKFLFENLNSLGYTGRPGIAGSLENCMFNFLRNHQTVLQSGCTFYLPTCDAQEFQFPHSRANTSFLFFNLIYLFILVLLVGRKPCLSVVLICISPVIIFLNVQDLFGVLASLTPQPSLLANMLKRLLLAPVPPVRF